MIDQRMNFPMRKNYLAQADYVYESFVRIRDQFSFFLQNPFRVELARDF